MADYLAKKGMPFRRAHEVVGHLVLLCEKRGCDLDDLSLADFKAESDLFEADIAGALDLESIVAARTTFGGHGHTPPCANRWPPRRPSSLPTRRNWPTEAGPSTTGAGGQAKLRAAPSPVPVPLPMGNVLARIRPGRVLPAASTSVCPL